MIEIFIEDIFQETILGNRKQIGILSIRLTRGNWKIYSVTTFSFVYGLRSYNKMWV